MCQLFLIGTRRRNESCFVGSVAAAAAAQKTWCVAKPSASNDILSLNLNYACSQVSCGVIQKGGPCYYPDNLVSRAAVAMNLYYAANGRHPWNCYFNNSALVVQSDPSTPLILVPVSSSSNHVELHMRFQSKNSRYALMTLANEMSDKCKITEPVARKSFKGIIHSLQFCNIVP